MGKSARKWLLRPEKWDKSRRAERKVDKCESITSENTDFMLFAGY
jgi:hypothetical protein